MFFDLDGIWWLHRTHELHIRLSHVYFPSQTHPEKLCRKFSGLFQVPWCGETRGSSFGTWQAISNPERLRPSFVVRLIRTNVLQVSRKLDVLEIVVQFLDNALIMLAQKRQKFGSGDSCTHVCPSGMPTLVIGTVL